MIKRPPIQLKTTYDPFRYWNTKRLRIQFMPSISGEEFMAFDEWLVYKSPVRTVLEVGCGFGRAYDGLRMWEHDWVYRGCDLSHWLAREFLRRHGKAPAQADGLALPYPDRSFDLVVSWDVMLHVPPDDIRGFIGEHLRVARRWLYVATLAVDHGNLRLAPHCFAHDTMMELAKEVGRGDHDEWKIVPVGSLGPRVGNRAHYYMERNGA